VSLEVSVDERACALQGYCARIAPDVFEVTDGAPAAHVRRPVVDGADDEALVEEAEATCPTRAIRLAPAR